MYSYADKKLTVKYIYTDFQNFIFYIHMQCICRYPMNLCTSKMYVCQFTVKIKFWYTWPKINTYDWIYGL